MLRLSLIIASLALSATAAAQDAVSTDGDKYRVLLENERVRVLEYRDRPGEKTHQHRHPAFVLYAIEPFKRTITLPDGKLIVREFKAGEVLWSEAQTHIGENVGQTDTHVIMVELKQDTADKTEKK
ncbi:cytoplasmic protein [Accumulibacter sp.]|uniref:cytoplasmic protein n=1 Tax=Accumulibacter sp. TaxID=2053492 RepID=UPI0028C3FDE1|nr:cytoplasmic protein [Accumulibacter sp.]